MRRDHERNVLMWLAAHFDMQHLQDYVLWALIVAGCALMLWLTPGCSSPTAPSAIVDAQHTQMAAFVACFGKELGWEVETEFTDEHRKIGAMDLGGWAACPGTKVVIWDGWLLGTYDGYDAATRAAMRDIAAHEVCHSTGLCDGLDRHGGKWRACYERLLGGEVCQ
jgi:hypothetical protein